MVLAPRAYRYCVRTSINVIESTWPGSSSEKSAEHPAYWQERRYYITPAGDTELWLACPVCSHQVTTSYLMPVNLKFPEFDEAFRATPVLWATKRPHPLGRWPPKCMATGVGRR